MADAIAARTASHMTVAQQLAFFKTILESLTEYLSNMSHELRTPLNAIIGFSELLHDGRVGAVSERQKSYVGDVLTSARHLLQLINDVLDLSKVETGKMKFCAELVDPAKLVR